jgi:hypothetical protein
VKKRNVLLEVVLRLLEDPFFEVDEVECVRVVNVFAFQPRNEVREVVGDFLTIEDAVDHVTAEQSHFYFVAKMRIDPFVLVNALKDVGSCRTI